MVHVMVAAATAWIFIALVAVFALVATAAAARAQGRRLERRMVAELGRRWDQQMQRVPARPQGDSRVGAEGPGDRPQADPELQITLEDLLSQRDVLLEEFQAVQAQIAMLKQRVDRRRPVMEVSEENIIRLHDVLPQEWAERRRR